MRSEARRRLNPFESWSRQEDGSASTCHPIVVQYFSDRRGSKRGFRTIDFDAAMVGMLLKEKERHQRFMADIPPEATGIHLGLVRLPVGALMFPAAIETGKDFDLTSWRNPRNFSKEFARKADLLGFGRVRFHDLRGIHATALLDAGVPVHTVAQRIGDDPAVLLRN